MKFASTTFALTIGLAAGVLAFNTPSTQLAVTAIIFSGLFIFIGLGIATEEKKDISFQSKGTCTHCGLETQPLHLCKCPQRNYKDGSWNSKIKAEKKRLFTQKLIKPGTGIDGHITSNRYALTPKPKKTKKVI